MTSQTRAAERLANIRNVKPLLEALRTIALANIQAARRQTRVVQSYRAQLEPLVPVIAPTMRPTHHWFFGRRYAAQRRANGRQLLVIFGSQRGLCGGFNNAIMAQARTWLAGHNVVKLHLLGHRLQRSFDQAALPYDRASSLPFSSIPTPSTAQALLTEWIEDYEDNVFDELYLLFHHDNGQAGYQPRSHRLLPFRQVFGGASPTSFDWPPPIVETAPEELFERVLWQLTVAALFAILIESALAEQSARYRLMEAAVQNADRLVAELTQEVQLARQEALTREVQALAAASRLI